ncbi:MAG: hypothetical protein ACJAYU_004623 [Bradymonadia bacterium]|jgi:hypothetical protein
MCDHGVCRPDIRPGPDCLRSADCFGMSECVSGLCRLPCWEDTECASGTCEQGFCTR